MDFIEENKKISIIIPCYNVEKYITRCVESLINQTIGIENLELIFVDDASTDTTVECLRYWESKYPDNILLVCSNQNHKPGAARNIGLSYASADYVGYVDADDWVEPTMYAKMYAKVEQYHPDVVSVLYTRDDENGSVKLLSAENANGETYVEIHSLEQRKELWRNGILAGGVWCGIYRRDMLLADSGLFFPEDLLYEDNYWGAILNTMVVSYYVINERLYHYVIHEESIILHDSSKHLERLVIELMKIEEYTRRGVFELFHDEIEYDFLKLYFINTLHIMFYRCGGIPYDIFCTMQKNVCEIFPDYERNPYLNQLSSLQMKLLALAGKSLSDTAVKTLAKTYAESIQKIEKE